MYKVLAFAVVAVLGVANVSGATTGTHSYIVRKQLFAQPNASAAAPIRDFVGGLGGSVDVELPKWFVVTLPDAAVAALKAHPAVRYLQQVISGPVPTAVTTATAHRVTPQHTVVGNSGPPWTTGSYAYDGAGNIKAIGGNAYRYDQVSRIVEANVNGNNETYAYVNPAGAFGNMTSKTTTPAGGTPLIVDLSTDPATNHLLNRTYDAAGNVVVHEGENDEFDPTNMQREKAYGGLKEIYIYNAADERVGVVECGGDDCSSPAPVTWSVRDEQGRVLRQFEGVYSAASGNPYCFSVMRPCRMWAWAEDYAYRGEALLAAERMPEEGGRRHFHLDHLGSPRLVTAHDGEQIAQHDYYPFGVEIPPSFQETSEGYDREEPARFTGHERDFNAGTTSENANYNDYMHARYAVPQWGRFLSVDPIIDTDKAVHVPQKWNRYSYALNNPVRYTDPTGKAETDLRCDVCTTPEMQAAFRQGQTLGLKWGLAIDTALIGGEVGISALAIRFPSAFMQLMGVGFAATTGVSVNSVSLDTNAVIAAVEHHPPGADAALAEAVGSQNPLVSGTVMREFLNKGSFGALANYLKTTAGMMTREASSGLVQELEARGLQPNDAKAVAAAIESGTKFLTRDENVLKKVPDIAVRY